MNGVTIGEKHSYNDWGLILSEKVISPPAPKTSKVEVPMRDGSIDLTEALSDEIKFEDRLISLTFTVIDPIAEWSVKISEIKNYLHGKRMKIIFDDDLAFYYIGRVTVNKWTSNKNIGTLVVECVAEPYKYDLFTSAEDWEWDTFDFEQGIINETGQIAIDGSVTVSLVCRGKRMVPVFAASAPMTMLYEGATYNLLAASQKFYDIFLREGMNEFTFTGKGTVSIDYMGGSL